MTPGNPDLILRRSVFGWLALATGLILLIPLIAMQLTDEVRWTWSDFVVMGSLVFGMGGVFVLASRQLPPERRLIVGVAVAAAFLYIWAELAVGIFTTLGS